MSAYPMTLYGLREPQPGPRWRQLFELTWPAYRRWYLSEGRDRRPSPVTAGAALSRHLPELLPAWARLAEQTGFDDDAIALLTHWNLPAFAPAAACSQAVTTADGPALVRNYDYRPDLFECVSLSTDYLQPVIGTSDCLWGLLDGVNGSGLVVSLTFGGETAVGEGFAIPLVVRYLLEVCSTVAQAVEQLRRIPISMSYNITMVDATGDHGTAHVGPDRACEFQRQPLATNHRWQQPVDPAHARNYQSVERFDRLAGLLGTGSTVDRVAAAMLEPPLHTRAYHRGFGTLYTAVYRAEPGSVTYRWPGTAWHRTFDSPDDTVRVVLTDA
ncbi:MAG TPA: C45 family peptidase [Microlunatus sp.]|nr:C45 family peptidase [Microlunatus sp.]